MKATTPKKRVEIFVRDDAEHKTTLRVWPELAVKIGLNESIFLLQLEFLLRLPDHGNRKVKDGLRWIYGSIRQLREDYFPFWSKNTVDRAIKSLLEQGLIMEGNYNRYNYDKTRWLTLDIRGNSPLRQLVHVDHSHLVDDLDAANRFLIRWNNLSQNGTPPVPKWDRLSQNGARESQNGTPIPETTTETTQRIEEEEDDRTLCKAIFWNGEHADDTHLIQEKTLKSESADEQNPDKTIGRSPALCEENHNSLSDHYRVFALTYTGSYNDSVFEWLDEVESYYRRRRDVGNLVSFLGADHLSEFWRFLVNGESIDLEQEWLRRFGQKEGALL